MGTVECEDFKYTWHGFDLSQIEGVETSLS